MRTAGTTRSSRRRVARVWHRRELSDLSIFNQMLLKSVPAADAARLVVNLGAPGPSGVTLATVLAAIGVYGVLAYTVAQRTRESGLRMALGADPSRVRMMVLRQVSWMTLLGGIVGMVVAFALGRMAESIPFQVQSYDPVSFIGAALLLCLFAFGAGFIPAVRASRIDDHEGLCDVAQLANPMAALRYE